MGMTRMQSNLTTGNAAVGARVLCLSTPDMSAWKKESNKDPDFILPVPKRIYLIRANVVGKTMRGIRLFDEKKVKIENKKAQIDGELQEPFFPYSCFLLLSAKT